MFPKKVNEEEKNTLVIHDIFKLSQWDWRILKIKETPFLSLQAFEQSLKLYLYLINVKFWPEEHVLLVLYFGCTIKHKLKDIFSSFLSKCCKKKICFHVTFAQKNSCLKRRPKFIYLQVRPIVGHIKDHLHACKTN